jgi:uncharacterized protein YbjT (DUF2867 family)
MHTAFVAGATGLTGRHVVTTLRARAIATAAHVRSDSPRLAEWRTRFSAMGAEVDATEWNADAIARTLATRRPSIVFGLLGTTRARAVTASREGRDPARESYDAVDVALTEQLIAGCVSIDPRPRFVYLSSIGAGDGARGAYLEARTRVERTLIASGLPYTIARPSFIVGDRDEARSSETFGAPIADGLLGMLGVFGARRTADRYRSITGEQLAHALVHVAVDETFRDRIVEAGELQSIARAARA